MFDSEIFLIEHSVLKLRSTGCSSMFLKVSDLVPQEGIHNLWKEIIAQGEICIK